MMTIAHILANPVSAHGGLTLLAREIAIGLDEGNNSLVLCPSCKNPDVAMMQRLNGIRLIEWKTKERHEEIENLIVRTLDSYDVRIVIIHGGDFSWGPLRGKRSVVNSISRNDRLIILVNHQSNAVFGRVPTGEVRTKLARVRAFFRFTSAWVLKNIQLYKTDVEVAVSDFEYRQALRRYFLFRNKFRLIYHSRLPAAPLGDEILSRKEKSILCVGHFAYRKGQHVLLKAFGIISSKHPEWTLQLVGANEAGEYRSLVEKTIDDYGIRERVEIVTETHDPDKYFANASIYVQPSLMEAYGLALQEAKYFGCACVGASTGGITDSINDRNYLFPAGDHQILASILQRLMNDEEVLNEQMKFSLNESAKMGRHQNSMISEYRDLIFNLTNDNSNS